MSSDGVYRNAAIWSDKQRKFIEKGDYDLEDGSVLQHLQDLANAEQKPVYVVREFIVVDSEYQDQPPSKSARDWYVWKVDPETR